jgi:hypothetical protein
MRNDAMRNRVRAGEKGFALVLAILSLMLLTFLGLTLATTTSTELQIATNYRWSQQALYNAEAGLEAARVVLANVATTANGWQPQLPPARVGPWNPGAAPAVGGPVAGRDYDHAACDTRGGIGYGRILVDNNGVRYEDANAFLNQSLNGAFTVWIRRALVTDNGGQIADETRNDELVIVAEGVAPFAGVGDPTAVAFTRSRQAVRLLETRFTLVMAAAGEPCGIGKSMGQEGGSPMGENFNPCAPVTAGASGSLANVFGGAGSGAGGLTSTGVQ